MSNEWGKTYPGDRYQSKTSKEKIVTPYDESSKLFEELAQTGYQPVFIQTINLTSAGSAFINVPGYHFVFYGHDGSTAKPVNTNILVNTWINKRTNDGTTGFPAKHARGYSGPFAFLALEWAAQSNAYADLIIFKSNEKPWIDGEACT